MKKTIAVDVDNVLANHAEILMSFYNSIAGTNLTSDDYSEDWRFVGEKEDDIRGVGEKFVASGVHLTMTPISGSATSLKKLKDKYELVIITARKNRVREMTLKWVEEHFPDTFNDIHFAQIWEKDGQKITKGDLSKQIGADYLIDDSLEHCKEVSSVGISCILFGNYNWNQTETLPDGVSRCNDWQEVLEYFDGQT